MKSTLTILTLILLSSYPKNSQFMGRKANDPKHKNNIYKRIKNVLQQLTN